MCRHFLEREFSLARTAKVVLLVGKMAIDAFLGKQPLDRRRSARCFARGERLYVPLPHACGVSRWLNVPRAQRPADQALDELSRLRVELGLAPIRWRAMWQGHRVSVGLPRVQRGGRHRRGRRRLRRHSRPSTKSSSSTTTRATPTAARAEAAGARVVREPRQGYGHALRRGLAEAQGEYVVLAEPDGTFMGKDVLKLLAYADDFDLVLGTRTTRELIWHGANMGWQLRWGNWLVAKLLQVLFGGPSLSDCGCTLRLVRRSAAERLLPRFTVGGSHFLPEMVCLALLERPAPGRSAGQLPRARRRIEDHRLDAHRAARRRPHGRADPALPPLRAVTPRRASLLAAVRGAGCTWSSSAAQLDRPLMYDDANFALGDQGRRRHGPAVWQSGLDERPGRLLAARAVGAVASAAVPLRRRAAGANRRLDATGAAPAGGRSAASPPPLLSFVLASRPDARSAAAQATVAGVTAVALVAALPAGRPEHADPGHRFPAAAAADACCSCWLYLRLEATRRAWLWLAPLFALHAVGQDDQPAAAGRGDRRLAGSARPVCAVACCTRWALALAAWAVRRRLAGDWPLLGFPLDMPFGVNLVQWQDSADVARRAYASPGAFVDGLQPTVLWLGPGLVALGLIGHRRARRRNSRAGGRCATPTCSIGVAGRASSWVMSTRAAGWFPKYQVALAPLLACLAAPLIAHAVVRSAAPGDRLRRVLAVAGRGG